MCSSCCCCPRRRTISGSSAGPQAPQLGLALIVDADIPLKKGHILSPRGTQAMLDGTPFELARLAVADTSVGVGRQNWINGSGWFVVKDIHPTTITPIYPPAPVPTIAARARGATPPPPPPSRVQIVEVLCNGDTVLLSDIDPSLHTAWTTAGSFGLFLSLTPGVPTGFFPDGIVQDDSRIISLRVATRATLYDFKAGKGQPAFRICSETPDTVSNNEIQPLIRQGGVRTIVGSLRS